MVSISTKSAELAPGESDAMVGSGLFSILELGLRDGRAKVDVPERRCFELIGGTALEQPKERSLRHPLRAAIDGGVGQRPVNGEPEVTPQMLEGLLVLGGQPVAQLDEIGTRDGDRLLAGLLWRLKCRVVRQRRIAPDTVVVLHAPLGRQSVVVPPHRVEHRLAAHALKPRDDVGVRVREHVTDVQRATDGRRRRVDRIDLVAAVMAIESIGAAGLPALRPFRLEAFQRWFFRKLDWMLIH